MDATLSPDAAALVWYRDPLADVERGYDAAPHLSTVGDARGYTFIACGCALSTKAP